jgi:hypothetical protein
VSETPYLQTLTGKQLDAMIERRRRIYLMHLRNNNSEGAEIVEYHLGRAVSELMRREQSND